MNVQKGAGDIGPAPLPVAESGEAPGFGRRMMFQAPRTGQAKLTARGGAKPLEDQQPGRNGDAGSLGARLRKEYRRRA
jgi:hypothetical protein